MVITIIVLLILAGVALATLTGQGNIIGNAENAVGKYNNSVASEQQLLNEIEKYFQNYLEGGNEGNPPTPPDPVETPEVNENGLATENITIKPDPNSDIQITIPAGFAPAILVTGTTQSGPVEDGSVASIMSADQWNSITVEDINKGIVIVDNAITYDNGQTTGTTPDFNEYVWIPTPNFEEDFQQIAWNGRYYNGSSWITGEHPIAKNQTRDTDKQNKFWDDSTTQEYQDMLASVEQYKGFYIGRYEGSQGANDAAQSKRNISPWVNVSQTTAITACASNTYTLQNTGASEYWKANNIYDLAGNVYEWTQEKYSTGTNRAFRGGSYNVDGGGFPAAHRSSNDEGDSHYNARVPCQLFCSTGRW